MFLYLALLTIAIAYASHGYTLVLLNETIAGPTSPSEFTSWYEAMLKWRSDTRKAINYSDDNYRRPELAWTQRHPIQPQMMAHDRRFYDPVKRQYTVDVYVKDVIKRYGGIDAVLVWPTYPNIGIDNRNTDDLIRDMPGGVEGLKKMVANFHKLGIRVLFPIHPWDQGTRDPKESWASVLPKTMAEINADGLNGDTMHSVTKDYFDNSVAAGRPLALEPEIGLVNESISDIGWNVMSWGYWKDGVAPYVPMVSKNKWLETRHQVHVCNRWLQNKIPLLQIAFFNGVGFESWENIWSVWNQLTDRDSQAIRMIATIERSFSHLLVSPDWIPHYPMTPGDAIFSSIWPDRTTGQEMWTIVNRKNQNITASFQTKYSDGVKYYDLWRGTELIPKAMSNKSAVLAIPIEANGFGAVLASQQKDLPNSFDNFLKTMQNYSRHPLSWYSPANIVAKQAMTIIAATRPYRQAPVGMVTIPATKNFRFQIRGSEIEGENIGVDVQYPWETQPQRYHSANLTFTKQFYIDKTPVTNQDYQEFINATKYQPLDDHNFLRDWINGSYPSGWDKKPVTWVSLDDAAKFCKWNNKRLPNEWEWQYAAQGLDQRIYPWGNQFNAKNVPKPVTGRDLTAPDDVDAHPEGASPFGVLDLVGNVWQWTNEYADSHTRGAVLRGGSYYLPQGAMWYFPSDLNSYRLDTHNKYLLMAPSLDRAGTLGFRCAADSALTDN